MILGAITLGADTILNTTATNTAGDLTLGMDGNSGGSGAVCGVV